jgi:TonB family protein
MLNDEPYQAKQLQVSHLNPDERILLILMRALRNLALASTVLLLATGPAAAQAARKLINNPPPIYPDLAKRMHLTGVVKATLTIGPDGQVKNAEFQGGHPVLIDAVQNALRQWRYAPAPTETQQQVEFKF